MELVKQGKSLGVRSMNSETLIYSRYRIIDHHVAIGSVDEYELPNFLEVTTISGNCKLGQDMRYDR